jgi:pSer/pThr/pTyr-binding forkhead associated (FHA) protein
MRPTLVFPPQLEIPPTTADRSILLIGRHPQCDVVLRVDSVSRRHCVLVDTDDRLTIRDIGSKHGVWVNGVRVEERDLIIGDEVAIGCVIVRVIDPDKLADESYLGEADETADSPTEIQGESSREATPPDDLDSGFLTTDQLRPSDPYSVVSPLRNDSEKGRQFADPDDSGDDIPSDSKLEEVL